MRTRLCEALHDSPQRIAHVDAVEAGLAVHAVSTVLPVARRAVFPTSSLRCHQ